MKHINIKLTEKIIFNVEIIINLNQKHIIVKWKKNKLQSDTIIQQGQRPIGEHN